MKTSLFMTALILATVFLGQTGVNAGGGTPGATCSNNYGCHKGKCWMGCMAVLNNINGAEWCYANNWNKSDYYYCTQDNQCSAYRCAKCKGPCTV